MRFVVAGGGVAGLSAALAVARAGHSAGEPTDSGAIYYCRYFRLVDGVEHMAAPLLNPRGDLGSMGFNTFRGDNRTFAVILLAPPADPELRAYGVPTTDVLPMGGLTNVARTGDPGVRGLVAVGDALCHTDPARVSDDGAGDIGALHREEVGDEARERHRLACDTDEARSRHWSGEQLDFGHRDGCYPLFSFLAAIATAPHDDLILRRTIRRIGLLDRTAVFDDDSDLRDGIESSFARLMADGPPPRPGPPRDELLAALV